MALNKNFEKKDFPKSSEKADSNLEAVDQSLENLSEKEPGDLESGAEEKKPLEKSGESLVFKRKVKTLITDSDEERKKQIDKILSEGLNDVFLNMSPQDQKKFQEEGEKTVLKIAEALSHTKIKIKKIIDLIKRWLKLIPGVNKYFLEQEAKIKADKIIKLKNK